jgi:hypothetical protein
MVKEEEQKFRGANLCGFSLSAWLHLPSELWSATREHRILYGPTPQQN